MGAQAANSRHDPVTTSRLILTPISRADLDDLLVLYSDPLVAYWTGPWTTGVVERWVVNMAHRWATEGVGKWIARDRVDGCLIGRGGFTRFDLGEQQVLELGWAVRDALAGRGYATELGRSALDWAARHEPGVPIVAFTEVHNHASQAVMRRLGMRADGVIYREGLIEGHVGLYPDAPFALYRWPEGEQ